MERAKERVAIIGAGVSGLAALKNSLEEDFEPVCFERHDTLGGLWYYTNEVRQGQIGACYRSLWSNTPKALMSFTDFPLPREFPVFPSQRQMHEYLKQYAEHFGLEKYIRYKTNVVSVDKSGDYLSSGKWDVHFQDGGTREIRTETFDAVMVCTGGFGDVYIPNIPGCEQFRGLTMHANKYREPAPFAGKRVVIVGSSHTAGDISCELGHSYCEKVYMSVRNGTKVVSTFTASGWPTLLYFLKRAILNLPANLTDRLYGQQARLRFHDRHKFGLAVRYSDRPVSTMINDHIQDSIAAGQVTIIPEVVKFTGSGVILSDGSAIDNLDAVIFATGYLSRYGILDESFIFDDSDSCKLYKYIVPVDLKHPTLFIIGATSRIFPSFYTAVDVQTRWAAQVIKKELKLPSRDGMYEDIRSKKPIGRFCVAVPSTLYQDELAREIGVLPNFWKLLFTDPKLAYAFYFGTAVGAWYRLQGRASWIGARNTILGVTDDVLLSLNPRYKRKTWKNSIFDQSSRILAIAFCALAFCGGLYMRR
ncbi:flavin-containing monooxygenase 5-like [Ptychodera flava]|uniref:flavin-containing monooxygenase 5-like n=1 Tax=Ptychodera flava TaxID=63121 RepID=UPI00396A2FA1